MDGHISLDLPFSSAAHATTAIVLTSSPEHARHQVKPRHPTRLDALSVNGCYQRKFAQDNGTPSSRFRTTAAVGIMFIKSAMERIETACM